MPPIVRAQTNTFCAANLSCTVTGAWTFNAIPQINNVLWLDGVTNPQTAAGLNALLVTAGSTKEVWVPSTATTLTDAVIVLQKGSVLKFLGGGTFTVGPASGAFTTTPAIQLPSSLTDATANAKIECLGNAKILLAAGSNRDIITDTGYYTLQGSANTFGTYRVNIQNCRLDGNKANQAALVTRGTGNIQNIARSAGGIVTINFSNTPSPAYVVGDTVVVSPSAPATNASFITRAIVQSATATQITFNQLGATVAQFANTGTVVGYSGGSNVRIYGRDPQIINTFTASATLDGLDTSGAQIVSPVTIDDDTGCNISGVRSMNHGGDGWWFDGPDSCNATNNQEWGNSQWCRELTRAGLRDGVHTCYNTPTQTGGIGSLHLMGGNIQTTTNQETCQITGCTAILVDYNGGTNSFSSMLVAGGPGGTAAIGMEVRAAGQVFQGIIQTTGAGSTALKLNQGSGIFDITVTPSGANTGATVFDLASASLPPVIFLHLDNGGADTLFKAGSPVGNETLLGPGFPTQLLSTAMKIQGNISSWNGNNLTLYSDAGSIVQISMNGANGSGNFLGTLRSKLHIADLNTVVCTNGELALSAGWQSTGAATVTAVAGNGQTCSWTITTGTTTAANPTVTDTLTNALPAATTVCTMTVNGGTHTSIVGAGTSDTFRQTTLSATAPVFTYNETPTAGGTTYFVTRTCGP
jgi:hypothetical protein